MEQNGEHEIANDSIRFLRNYPLPSMQQVVVWMFNQLLCEFSHSRQADFVMNVSKTTKQPEDNNDLNVLSLKSNVSFIFQSNELSSSDNRIACEITGGLSLLLSKRVVIFGTSC